MPARPYVVLVGLLACASLNPSPASSASACLRDSLAKTESTVDGELRRAFAELGDSGPERLGRDLRIARAIRLVEDLEEPGERAEAELALASSLTALAEASADARELLQLVATRFEHALAAAERTQRFDLAAGAARQLGELYARDGQYHEAGTLLRRALFAANRSGHLYALLRAHIALGEWSASGGKRSDAIESFRSAGLLADRLRLDPAERGVYSRLADLLLREAAARATRQELLTEARDVLERGTVSTLREFYRDDCLGERRRVRPEALPGAVVVHPVPLPDRLELIVGRAGHLTRHRVDVGAAEFARNVRSFRALSEKATTRQYRAPAMQLYDWLVRPIDDLLVDADVQALVFVPQGVLATAPLAALVDRKSGRFLVERFPVAVAPGLTLVEPRPLHADRVRVLAAGISEPVQGFAGLPNVKAELAALEELWSAQTLLDASFVRAEFAGRLRGALFDVVHIASHAEFAGPDDASFLVAYDGPISIDALAKLVNATRTREDPIELLTLSACETAAGDERAALGLTGVALRAGARSALATLWAVDDVAASALMRRFYTELHAGASRAQALQLAQLQALARRELRHPIYWAGFQLFSSWL